MGQQKRMQRTSRVRKTRFPVLWPHFATPDDSNSIADRHWPPPKCPTQRPTGGLVAATRRPWYRRVLHPLIVPEANPPIPFVSQPFAAQRGINIAANILAKADHDTASREGTAGRDVGEPGIASTSSPSRLFS